MDAFHTPSGMELIPRSECLRLLASHHVGRIAFVVGGQPLVLPVNYAVEEGVIIIRTGEGAKLEAALQGKVAFEIDDFDEHSQSGWSVLVQGIADEINQTDDWFAERLRSVVPPPWIPAAADHYVRVTPSRISGRRLPSPPERAVVQRMFLPAWVPGDPARLG
jgi:uncharacterized protein